MRNSNPIPSPSQDKPSIPSGIQTPFPYITGHVVGPERADSRTTAYPHWTASGEVTEVQHVRPNPIIGGPEPVINSGDLFVREFGICQSFIPTHTANGEIIMSRGVFAQLPNRRSRPARGIVKLRHGLLPEQYAAILNELLPPVLPVLITTL